MKRFLFFLLTFISALAQNVDTNTYPYVRPLPTSGSTPGTTIRQTGTFNPTGYGGVPTVWDVFTGGGYRSVSNIVERDSIPMSRRKEMMLVGVTENTNVYVLGPGLQNTDWSLLNLHGENIYTADGTIVSNRVVNGNYKNLSITNVNELTFLTQSDITATSDGGTVYVNSTDASVYLNGYDHVKIQTRTGPYVETSWNSLMLDSTDQVFKIRTPAVNSGGALVNQVLTLGNASTGQVEFQSPRNIYTADGQIIANRNVDGNGKTMTFQSLKSLNVYGDYGAFNINTNFYVNVGGQINPQLTISQSSTLLYGAGSLTLTAGVGPKIEFTPTSTLKIVTPNVDAAGATVGQFLRLSTTSGVVEYANIAASSTVVPTVADLVALSTSFQTITNATTLGYWSIGDGGGANFYWVNNQTSTNRGTKIRSSVAGSWVMIDQSKLNVLQFGAKPDGTTASASRINEAVAYAVAQSNVPQVIIPEGTFAIDDTIQINGSNLRLDIYGKLKNTTNNPKSVIYVGPTSSLTITAGVVQSYPVQNVTINGHGTAVIDQNCQSLVPWNSETAGYDSYHTIYSYGVDGLTVKNLTVTNGVIWSMSIECNKNFEVASTKVYTGFANGRKVGGVLKYLGGQDGIHSHDSKNGFIHDNIVESGDDSLAVSAARTVDAGNVVVSKNKALVKVFAYEADGTTLNNNSVSGRFPLSVFNAAQSSYCALTNITFADNMIIGGQGLFYVADYGVSHTGVPTNVRFTGNTFGDQVSPGNPSVSPYPIMSAWNIDGAENVEFVGNTFNNIARVGRIGGSSGKNGTVTFRNNKFSNFKRGYPYNLFPSDTSAILWMTEGTRLVVEGNTFENNDIIPVLVGGFGDFTTNMFQHVSFNGNTCYRNNLRWSSSGPSASDYSAILNVNGANFVDFNNNLISTNYGCAYAGRSVKALTAKANTIRGLGNGSFTSTAEAFYINSVVDQSSIYTDIQNNNIANIDGQFVKCYNPGQLLLMNNVVNNACRNYDTGYLMYILVRGTSLSNEPYTSFGGNMFGNTFYRPSAQSVLYLDSQISTAGYTGNIFAFVLSNNNLGANYTGETITANANHLH